MIVKRKGNVKIWLMFMNYDLYKFICIWLIVTNKNLHNNSCVEKYIASKLHSKQILRAWSKLMIYLLHCLAAKLWRYLHCCTFCATIFCKALKRSSLLSSPLHFFLQSFMEIFTLLFFFFTPLFCCKSLQKTALLSLSLHTASEELYWKLSLYKVGMDWFLLQFWQEMKETIW